MDAATRAGRARQIGLEKAANRKTKKDELKRQEAIRASELAREKQWREEDRANELSDLDRKQRDAIAIQTLKNQGKKDAEDTKPFIETLPAAAQKEYSAASQIASNFPALIDKLDEDAGAFGLQHNLTTMAPKFFPNAIMKPAKALEASMLTDSEEQTKSEVFQGAYEVINELAGATLSPEESDKISKFLPVPEDSLRTIKNKLKNALAEARKTTGNIERLYGGKPSQPQQQPQQTAQQAPEPPNLTPEMRNYWNELTPEQKADYLRLKGGQ
jgi:hypothetical protein